MDTVSGDFVLCVLQNVSASTRLEIFNTSSFQGSLSGVWGYFEDFFEMYTLDISFCYGELFLHTRVNTEYGLLSLPPDFSFWKRHRSAFSRLSIEKSPYSEGMYPLTDDAVEIIEKILQNLCLKVDILRLPDFGLEKYPSILRILDAIPAVNYIYARYVDINVSPSIERWVDTLWKIDIDHFKLKADELDYFLRLTNRIIENLSKRRLGSLILRIPKPYPYLYRRFLNTVFFNARAGLRYIEYDSTFQDVVGDFIKTLSVSDPESDKLTFVDKYGIRFSFTDCLSESNANGWRLWFFFDE
ncbi:hypothetical protein QR680_006820 [Steinernema hermaphroditum]|uniref:Uncharacterized protein n=1 Tax=Steinernema hermaphroditum TaxID=289476 RepID=A0AA39HYZ2_9BILA|nr:hypothetical protein QR680_006820 [Steinernema hermaphroditum]